MPVEQSVHRMLVKRAASSVSSTLQPTQCAHYQCFATADQRSFFSSLDSPHYHLIHIHLLTFTTLVTLNSLYTSFITTLFLIMKGFYWALLPVGQVCCSLFDLGIFARATNCTQYTVKDGDSCLKIGKANNATYAQIMSWNPDIKSLCS
jgi:hypothetical protein